MTLDRLRRGIVQTLKLLAALVVVVVVVLSVAHAFPAVVGASESYVVTSGSMEPTIHPGDVIFVYETDATALEEGDIVAFDEQRGDNEVVTHRVVEVVQDDGVAYVTRGDANEDPDPGVVRPQQVVGTVPTRYGVPARVPALGQLLLLAGSREGIILLVFVPVGLLIASELYTLVRHMTADSSGNDAEAGPGDDGDRNGHRDRASDVTSDVSPVALNHHSEMADVERPAATHEEGDGDEAGADVEDWTYVLVPDERSQHRNDADTAPDSRGDERDTHDGPTGGDA